jgi:hypothetical protein
MPVTSQRQINISGPKRWTVGVNKNISLSLTNGPNFWTLDTRHCVTKCTKILTYLQTSKKPLKRVKGAELRVKGWDLESIFFVVCNPSMNEL